VAERLMVDALYYVGRADEKVAPSLKIKADCTDWTH